MTTYNHRSATPPGMSEKERKRRADLDEADRSRVAEAMTNLLRPGTDFAILHPHFFSLWVPPSSSWFRGIR